MASATWTTHWAIVCAGWPRTYSTRSSRSAEGHQEEARRMSNVQAVVDDILVVDDAADSLKLLQGVR
jgi:hypothetical protein